MSGYLRIVFFTAPRREVRSCTREANLPSAVDLERWPELPYAAWKDTYETLHLWTQIIGKIRLTHEPWLNHSWHVPLYVTVRGLTTSPIPVGGRALQIDFDFIDHLLWLRTSDGHVRQVMLAPKTVAEFYSEVAMALVELGLETQIFTRHPRLPTASRSKKTRSTQHTTATMPIASGASCFRHSRSFRGSGPASSARSARCISSGAASTLR